MKQEGVRQKNRDNSFLSWCRNEGLWIVMRGRVNLKRIPFDPAHFKIIEVKFVHLNWVRPAYWFLMIRMLPHVHRMKFCSSKYRLYSTICGAIEFNRTQSAETIQLCERFWKLNSAFKIQRFAFRIFEYGDNWNYIKACSYNWMTIITHKTW